mgnify:CR=1 FL=1
MAIHARQLEFVFEIGNRAQSAHHHAGADLVQIYTGLIYGGPTAPRAITRGLVEEGRQWNVLDGEIALDIPVRILQGGLDEDVPWTHSLDLADKLRSKDVVWSLIKDGDHRLSRPQDIARMVATVLATADQVDAA